MSSALVCAVVALALLALWTISFLLAHVVNKDLSTFSNAVRFVCLWRLILVSCAFPLFGSLHVAVWKKFCLYLSWLSEFGAYGPSKKFILFCWWTMSVLSALTLTSIALLDSSLIHGLVCLGIFSVCRFCTSLFPTRVHLPQHGLWFKFTLFFSLWWFCIGFFLLADRNADTAASDSGTPDAANSNQPPRCVMLLHALFAVLSFISIVIAAYYLRHFLDTKILPILAYILIAASVLMFVFGFLGRQSSQCHLFGLFERLFYFSHVVWFYVILCLMIVDQRSWLHLSVRSYHPFPDAMFHSRQSDLSASFLTLVWLWRLCIFSLTIKKLLPLPRSCFSFPCIYHFLSFLRANLHTLLSIVMFVCLVSLSHFLELSATSFLM